MSISPETNIPNNNSTAQDWIQWYDSLDSYFDNATTKFLFNKAWSLRGGTSARGNTTELRDFLKTKGLSIETNSLEDITDFTKSVGTSIGSGISTILKVGKYAGISIVVIGVGSLAMLAYGLLKNPAQSAGTVIKYAK